LRPFSVSSLKLTLGSILLACLLVACEGFAGTEVTGPDGQSLAVDRAYFEAHAAEIEGSGDTARLPLERPLADSGYLIIDRVTLDLGEEGQRAFPWEQVMDQAWVLADGRIAVGSETFDVQSITAETDPALDLVKASLTDLAPTAAQALGLRRPAGSQGKSLNAPRADHVLMLFLDGFGYLRYQQARQAGLIPILASLGTPIIGVATYPPITAVSTASILTGAPPPVHGVDRRGIRMTESETLFDVAQQAGLEVRAVEGEALAFQLRGAEFELSGDRNNNGMTDDEVLQNAIDVLREGAPDLFFVHFHGIDDAGHTYGPGSAEESQVVAFVDAAVGEILAAMPANSLILIFADHGMHRVEEEGRLGNHGHLIPLDMLVPIIMVSR
jgi:hypothetical protein